MTAASCRWVDAQGAVSRNNLLEWDVYGSGPPIADTHGKA